jgi:lysophospholipase L1-like esterase
MIKPGSIILFQGDSISDINRHTNLQDANHNRVMGIGFCNYIAARLLRERPTDNLKFYNKAIGGNRIVDLYARWKVDAINLKPDLISILIGVNDTWHAFSKQNGVEPERFEIVYRMMLDYTKQQLPQVQLVLCEPFVYQCGVVTEDWMEEMRQRQQTVKKLAMEFDGRFVPFQSALNKALDYAPPEYWLGDGVHPTLPGHWILSECWYETVIGGQVSGEPTG